MNPDVLNPLHFFLPPIFWNEIHHRATARRLLWLFQLSLQDWWKAWKKRSSSATPFPKAKLGRKACSKHLKYPRGGRASPALAATDVRSPRCLPTQQRKVVLEAMSRDSLPFTEKAAGNFPSIGQKKKNPKQNCGSVPGMDVPVHKASWAPF